MNKSIFMKTQIKAYNEVHNTQYTKKTLPEEVVIEFEKAWARVDASQTTLDNADSTPEPEVIDTAKSVEVVVTEKPKKPETEATKGDDVIVTETAELLNKVDQYSKVNADGHIIVKNAGYLVKLQISKRGIKIRSNKKFAEASGFDHDLHDNWNVKYEVYNCTAAEVLEKFLQLATVDGKEDK